MSDIYRTPDSELTQARDSVDIEEALERAGAGDFDFRPIELIGEAWSLLDGAKLPILLGTVAMYVASFVVQFAGNLLMNPETQGVATIIFGSIGVAALQAAVTTPIWGGLIYMGLRRVAGDMPSPNDIGSQFHRAGALIATTLLSMVLIYVGFVLLIIPGIYLSVAYLLAIPLVVDKGLSPWRALEASRRAISRCWFRMFGMMLLLGIILLLSAVPLLLGLIWTIPLGVVTFALAYRYIFGISSGSASVPA